MAKISILKKEGITVNTSYERHVYESVDDKSIIIAIGYISTFDKK